MEMFVEFGVPGEYYLGPALYTAAKAAGGLAGQFGMSPETIPLRSVKPLNYKPLADSSGKAGKVLPVSDAVEREPAIKSAAANLAQVSFAHLDAPPSGRGVQVLDHPGTGAGDHVLPPARVAHRLYPLTDSTTYGKQPNHEPVPRRTVPPLPPGSPTWRGRYRPQPGTLDGLVVFFQ